MTLMPKPMERSSMSWDELWTPPEALAPLLPYLSTKPTVWEICPGEGNLVNHLRSAGCRVLYANNMDGLITYPEQDYDLIVTNPPYSNKHKWLRRCVELDKPFALLLPVTTLGVRRCQKWLDRVDVLFLKRRVDFTGGKAPWFAVAWFTHHILPERMIFEELT